MIISNKGDHIVPETITFNTLAYAKKLKAVGFTEDQAEVQAEALAQIIDERLATKQDILALRRDINGLENSLRRDMKEMDNSLRRDMKEMELRLKHDLTLRLGAMLAATVAIFAALVKLL